MYFLIEFNPPEKQLITFKTYSDSEHEKVKSDRLALEIKLNQSGIQHEIVTLQAESVDALKKTHRRYFYTPKEILEME